MGSNATYRLLSRSYLTGYLQPEIHSVPSTQSRDVMYEEMHALIARWASRGIDEETILSRFHCVAVQSMQAAGVTFQEMVELIALHYKARKIIT